jgi:hypothetical protein
MEASHAEGATAHGDRDRFRNFPSAKPPKRVVFSPPAPAPERSFSNPGSTAIERSEAGESRSAADCINASHKMPHVI